MAGSDRKKKQQRSARCMICGCTDTDACVLENGSTCSWVIVDYILGHGICSECKHFAEEAPANLKSLALRGLLESNRPPSAPYEKPLKEAEHHKNN